ncbi:MAG: VWA domain-containing protein, partial [Phycisphaerales bacterium]|nr:VWA domain-containing protein [Phycisphaerales bacterium]
EYNDKLESKQEDIKRGGEGQQGGKPNKGQQGNQSGQSGQGQDGQGNQSGNGKADNSVGDGQKGNKGGDPNQKSESGGQQGGGSEHGRGTSDIDLPDLEELIRMKQEMESMYEQLKTDYDRYHGPVASYADELAGELKNFLQENTRPKFKREMFPTGRKLDMRAAMQSEARFERTGEFDTDIWLRRNNPTERGYEFVFVLDESGSMKGGDKWRNALQALVLSAEALDQLDINFGLIGFSDMPKVHKELTDKFSLESRGRMLADVETSPSGGTNDSDGVKSAIEMLKKGEPDKKKILVVITDGEGKEQELKQQIAIAKELGISVIGVGIDSGMAHVENVYPEHVLVPRISQMPAKFAEMLKQQIEGEFDAVY